MAGFCGDFPARQSTFFMITRSQTIAVCACTYQRPQGLRRLLESLGRQENLPPGDDPSAVPAGTPGNTETAESNSVARPVFDVVIIDNDPEQSAETICREMAPSLPYRLVYHHEARRGITFARNAALEVATVQLDADLIAFLDDDEEAEPHWLARLLHAMDAYRADVVSGSVRLMYEQPPPDWLVQSGLLRHLEGTPGQQMHQAATCNVLFRRRVLAPLDTYFDHRLALVGGEDSHLFRRVHRAGFSIVYCERAAVKEYIPADRMTISYVLRRAFRIGNTVTFIERDLRSWPVAALLTIPTACYRILKSCVMLPICLFRRKWHRVFYTRLLYYGLGMLAGWANVRYKEYA